MTGNFNHPRAPSLCWAAVSPAASRGFRLSKEDFVMSFETSLRASFALLGALALPRHLRFAIAFATAVGLASLGGDANGLLDRRVLDDGV